MLKKNYQLEQIKDIYDELSDEEFNELYQKALALNEQKAAKKILLLPAALAPKIAISFKIFDLLIWTKLLGRFLSLEPSNERTAFSLNDL